MRVFAQMLCELDVLSMYCLSCLYRHSGGNVDLFVSSHVFTFFLAIQESFSD
jgi:hypothetical protein